MKNAPQTTQEIHSQILRENFQITLNAKSYGQDHIIQFLDNIKSGHIFGALCDMSKNQQISPSINADHPLRLAAVYGKDQMCAILLKKGANVQGDWSDEMKIVLEKALRNADTLNPEYIECIRSRLKF